MELIELERRAKETGAKFNRVTRLKDELSKVKDNYDFIFIDCPPSLGILTTNALAAADSVLILFSVNTLLLKVLCSLLIP